jgi:hypothetical protein
VSNFCRRSSPRLIPPPACPHSLGQRSRSHELLPKNSNNSPRHMISQNNSIVISVWTLACAARFRANAGSKSVGMIGRPHAQPLLRRNNAYRAVAVSLPSAKSGNIRRWQKLRSARRSAAKLLTKDEALTLNRRRISGITRRSNCESAADCGEHRQAVRSGRSRKATRAATSELSGDRARKRAFRALAFILILRMALGLGR